MALINCAECGKQVSDLAACCPHCGAPVQKKEYCKECGNQVSESASVCPNCGCPRAHSTTPPPFEQSAERAASPAVPGLFDECGCGRSRGLTAMLAFFLGSLGAQYFYLGKTGAGITVLLLSFLFWWTVVVPVVISVLCLIQTIMLMTMSHEEFERKMVYSTSFMPLW